VVPVVPGERSRFAGTGTKEPTVPKRDVAPIGAPCWVDLLTSDPARSQEFYRRLFGWTVEDPGADYGGYQNFLKDGIRVAGSMRNDGEAGVPDLWSVYLAVDDAEKTVAQAEAHGAQVMVPAMDVMTLGRMAVVVDPGGAVIGMWQPGEFQGFGILAEANAPSWFELHTRDYEASVAFYREVFGWDTHTESDTPEFRYTTLGEGDEAKAGLMDSTAILPEGVPSHWAVYFGVDDTDAALSEIVALGGEVVTPAEDTPYGRLAMASDATGALFRLVG
jgi:predicted enzyme related to lactoylglutathione lyase